MYAHFKNSANLLFSQEIATVPTAINKEACLPVINSDTACQITFSTTELIVN